jgi:hypothetical protein
VASPRSTVALIRSLVPPEPFTGSTWSGGLAPAGGTQAWGSTVTVTVAVPQSAVPAALTTSSQKL